MNSIKDNINIISDMVKKRETYIRFSPVGTAITGILCVMYSLSYYFFDIKFSPIAALVLIAVFSIILVTILSLYNSKNKQEDILPSSIRYVIGNIITLAFVYACISYFILPIGYGFIIGVGFLMYGTLILVSRLLIPKYIVYMGYISLLSGFIIISPLNINMLFIIGLVLGVGHIIISYFLYQDNK